MGIPKHKPSAHQKQCKKYKDENRYEKNKARKAAKHKKRMEYFAKRRAAKEAAAQDMATNDEK